jgi:hypothetical protein
MWLMKQRAISNRTPTTHALRRMPQPGFPERFVWAGPLMQPDSLTRYSRTKSSSRVTPRPGLWHFDPAIDGLDLFFGELMPHRRVIDAVLENERIPARAQPVEACGHGDGAGITMVAKARTNFLDARADVGRIGEPAARQVHLVDIECVTIDERAKRFATALCFAGGDRDG